MGGVLRGWREYGNGKGCLRSCVGFLVGSLWCLLTSGHSGKVGLKCISPRGSLGEGLCVWIGTNRV